MRAVFAKILLSLSFSIAVPAMAQNAHNDLLKKHMEVIAGNFKDVAKFVSDAASPNATKAQFDTIIEDVRTIRRNFEAISTDAETTMVPVKVANLPADQQAAALKAYKDALVKAIDLDKTLETDLVAQGALDASKRDFTAVKADFSAFVAHYGASHKAFK